jgi:hypothetical protein
MEVKYETNLIIDTTQVDFCKDKKTARELTLVIVKVSRVFVAKK